MSVRSICFDAVPLACLMLVSEVVAGSGSRGYSAPSRGSGSRSPEAEFAGAVLRFEGDLKRGQKGDDAEAKLAGFIKLENGVILSATAPGGPGDGSGNRSAAAASPRLTLVVNQPNASQPIGSYRLSKRGRLTLFFGSEADDERVAADSLGEDALHGVMVLTHKKRRSGEFWTGSFREMEDSKTVRTWQVRVESAKQPRRAA